MIIFVLIALVAIFKSIADTIKVREKFNASIWSKFTGNRWIDPNVSWQNQYTMPFYRLTVHFSDLWHFCNSAMLGLLFLVPFLYQRDYFVCDSIVLYVSMWIVYGAVFETFYALWKWLK